MFGRIKEVFKDRFTKGKAVSRNRRGEIHRPVNPRFTGQRLYYGARQVYDSHSNIWVDFDSVAHLVPYLFTSTNEVSTAHCNTADSTYDNSSCTIESVDSGSYDGDQCNIDSSDSYDSSFDDGGSDGSGGWD